MKGIRVQMRAPCRFCRCEWESWLACMIAAAHRAFMLPGQQAAPRRDAVPFPAVDLVVSSDGAIAAVNRRSLGCQGPTNILSFPEEGRLGSLFLSAQTLEREIFLYGQDPAEHARRLLAHGFGHICGFDHGDAMDDFCSMLEESCRCR